MLNKEHSFHLNLLMICALFAVAISPACKFKSGESGFMEICTAFGIKIISVPQNAPVSAPTQDNTHTKPPCMFCVAGQIHQAVLSEASHETLLKTHGGGRFWQENSVFQNYKTHSYDATGPPVLS